jgi:predicted permease
MSNFLLIGLCILAGYVLQRSGKLPADGFKTVNAWIINLALPGVSFKFLPHIHWDRTLLLPVLMPVVVWIAAWVYIAVYAGKKTDKRTRAGLLLTTGLSNTSFVGFPLVIAYFSHAELSIAVICDQVSFLLLATVGVVTALRASGGENIAAAMLARRIISFPPFIACVLALTLPAFVDLSFADPLFDMLAATIAPLALFSIGLQIRFEGWQDEIKHIKYALLFKLLIAPAIIFMIAWMVNMKNIQSQVSIFESAMPPFLTSGIIASAYNLNPRLTNLIIGIGILLSFLTTAVWYWLIQLCFA